MRPRWTTLTTDAPYRLSEVPSTARHTQPETGQRSTASRQVSVVVTAMPPTPTAKIRPSSERVRGRNQAERGRRGGPISYTGRPSAALGTAQSRRLLAQDLHRVLAHERLTGGICRPAPGRRAGAFCWSDLSTAVPVSALDFGLAAGARVRVEVVPVLVEFVVAPVAAGHWLRQRLPLLRLPPETHQDRDGNSVPVGSAWISAAQIGSSLPETSFYLAGND